jgi:hypothetical protein
MGELRSVGEPLINPLPSPYGPNCADIGVLLLPDWPQSQIQRIEYIAAHRRSDIFLAQRLGAAVPQRLVLVCSATRNWRLMNQSDLLTLVAPVHQPAINKPASPRASFWLAIVEDSPPLSYLPEEDPEEEDPLPDELFDPGVVFRLFPFVSVPGVDWESAPWLECLESGTVFKLLPLVLLPGVFAPEEDEEDIPPEDELAGVCARMAEAITMLAIDVATPK